MKLPPHAPHPRPYAPPGAHSLRLSALYSSSTPCAGWGSLEYGSLSAPGVVVGGRWKPLHYMLRDLYRDVFVTCGFLRQEGGLVCYVRNDSPLSRVDGAALVLTALRLNDGRRMELLRRVIHLPIGPGVIQWIHLAKPPRWARRKDPLALLQVGCRIETCILTADIVHSLEHGERPLASSLVLLATPARLLLPQPTAPPSATVATVPNSDASINVTVMSSHAPVSLFVTLTTQAPGRFSDNSFLLMHADRRVLQFHPFIDSGGPETHATLTATLRVQCLGSAMGRRHSNSYTQARPREKDH